MTNIQQLKDNYVKAFEGHMRTVYTARKALEALENSGITAKALKAFQIEVLNAHYDKKAAKPVAKPGKVAKGKKPARVTSDGRRVN